MDSQGERGICIVIGTGMDRIRTLIIPAPAQPIRDFSFEILGERCGSCVDRTRLNYDRPPHALG